MVEQGEKTMEKEALQHEATLHVENFTVPVADGRKCIDGGYKEDEAVGQLARPGGDLGLSMALLEMGHTPQEAFDIVYKFAVDRGTKYAWHTDTHVDPKDANHHEHKSDALVGCGHCNAAIKQAVRYSDKITGEQFNELLQIVRAAQADPEKMEHMELVNLDRDHTEKAILLIMDKERTVKPWNEKENKQFFVYDVARDEDLVSHLVYFMAEQGLIKDEDRAKTFEELWNNEQGKEGVIQRQNAATLGILGTSKGADLFAVTWKDNKPSLTHVGNAPIAS